MHSFKKKSYSAPTYCACCKKLLVGITNQGMQCNGCKLDVHKGCVTTVSQKFTCLNQGSAVASGGGVSFGSGEMPNDSATSVHSSGMADFDSNVPVLPVAHIFQPTTFRKPTYCSKCNKLLVGITNQGVRCSICGLVAHKGSCASSLMAEVECDPSRKAKSGPSGSNSAKLSAAVGGATAAFGRMVRRSSEESGPSISGPTHVVHTAGHTTDRTLVSLADARNDARNRMEPVAANAPTNSVAAVSEDPSDGPRAVSVPNSAINSAKPPPPPPSASTRPNSEPAPWKAPLPPAAISAAGRRPPAPAPAAPRSSRPAAPPPPRPRPPSSPRATVDVSKLQISEPTSVTHDTHATYDAAKGAYEGLPAEWRGSSGASALCFGTSLLQQPRTQVRGYTDRIPNILILLGRDLRRRNGFVAEGLFRISASRDEQSQARAKINSSSNDCSVTESLRECQDTHVIAALIKEWCRMLHGSILGELNAETLASLAGENLEECAPSQAFSKCYHDLLYSDNLISLAKRSSFLWLLDLMRETAKHKEHNRMNERAVATCFAPSLLVLDDPRAAPTESIQLIKLATAVLINAMLYLDKYDNGAAPRDLFADSNLEFL